MTENRANLFLRLFELATFHERYDMGKLIADLKEQEEKQTADERGSIALAMRTIENQTRLLQSLKDQLIELLLWAEEAKVEDLVVGGEDLTRYVVQALVEARRSDLDNGEVKGLLKKLGARPCAAEG